jgi:hypothetical protein
MITRERVLNRWNSNWNTIRLASRHFRNSLDFGRPLLLAAAHRGDTNSVEKLLQDGANPNTQDARGETALHKAVNGRHLDTAACLLTYGADFSIADSKGRLPLAPEYIGIDLLHAIRQRYRRFRPASALPRQPIPQSQEWARELQKNGIMRISGLISPEQLQAMRNGFEKFIGRVQENISKGQGQYEHYDQQEYWWEPELAFVSNNAFKESPELVNFCCSQPVVDTVHQYYGKMAYISRGNAMRYLPHEERKNDMFGWHHDMEEKRLKVMILLTDVGEGDQTMSYVLGSHALYHPYKMFFQNRCSLEYCRKRLGNIEIFRTTGKAGDVFLFDSNGAHRGNRKPEAAVRDAIFIEYTVDNSDIWGADIPQAVFGGNGDVPDDHPFSWIMSVPPKWTLPRTRTAPTWVENLAHVDKWL